MKLAFLCTSVEPGRDGVGDYTRQLADACVRLGRTIHILALRDPFVHTAAQSTTAAGVPILRLPAAASWTDTITAAENCLSAFAPDWISWQIVPYGFHPKGVMPSEAFALSRLANGAGNHVLLHELWIGLSRGEPLKNRVWEFFQRRALLRFLDRLSPTVLQTTNPTYQEVLRRHGRNASLLPLFGNIPVESIAAPAAKTDQWTGGIFGTVHPQFAPEPCFTILDQGAHLAGRRLRIIGFGRLGDYGEALFARLAAQKKNDVEFVVAGEKTPSEISHLLHSLDFGIGTHPWALAGKSGAIAAMLDHGLPVIVPRDDWTLRSHPVPVPSIDPLMIRLSDMTPASMAQHLASRRRPAARLDAIAADFLRALTSTRKEETRS